MKTPLDFIVTGLPRSGTTWIANWLTTDKSLCLHDPFTLGLPESWPKDHRLRGISCTGAHVMRKWLAQYDCPIIVIDRDTSMCDESLRKLGLPSVSSYDINFSSVIGRRFKFDDLWLEEKAEELWSFLLPSIPFDSIRYRLLQCMHVQPHLPTLKVNQQAMHSLIDGGLYRGEL